MHIETIQESLAIQINSNPQWADKLNDCNPGHYGVEDFDVDVSEKDIWVNIPEKTFSFNNTPFSFKLKLGSSNDEDGFKSTFSKVATGSGTFKFETGRNITIESLEIVVDLDLFA